MRRLGRGAGPLSGLTAAGGGGGGGRGGGPAALLGVVCVWRVALILVVFVFLDRNLSGEECHELAEKYFETHKQMTLPGQVLLVDLRPAYRKPLANVTPQFRAVSKGHTFTPQR